MRNLLLLALALPLGAANDRPAPVAPPTLMAQPLAPLVIDTLAAGSDMARWNAPKGRWERRPEGLRGEEVEKDKHNAVNRLVQPLGDFVFACELRFDGARGVNFSVNDAKDHLARVLLTPTAMTLRKDAREKKGNEPVVLLGTAPVKLEAGGWHTLVVEMVGDAFVATLDGQTSLQGTNPAFRAAKVSPGFTVDGSAATFRNVSVWSARPDPKAEWRNRKEPAPKTEPASAPPK